MKKLIPNLMAALVAAAFIAALGCDATPIDPDAVNNEIGEEVDDNESEEEPAKIDLSKEPKIEKKKGPDDNSPPKEKE